MRYIHRLKIQRYAVVQEGVPFNLIVSLNTQYISGPLLRNTISTGARVIRYNPVTGRFTKALLGSASNPLRASSGGHKMLSRSWVGAAANYHQHDQLWEHLGRADLNCYEASDGEDHKI